MPPERFDRDDVRSAIDALASEVPAPGRGSDEIVARGRRRNTRRRVAVFGFAAVCIAAFTIVGVLSATHEDVQVITSVPTTAFPTPSTVPTVSTEGAVPTASSQYPSSREAWKCGDPLQYTTDGGVTWYDIALPADTAGLERGLCVTAVPGGNAWGTWPNRVGTNWHITRIRAGRDVETFPLPPVPNRERVGEPTFIDANHGWIIIGPDNGPVRLYRTFDGGATWTVATQLPTLGQLAFTDADNGWARFGRTVQRTSDGGATWKEVAVPTPAGARDEDLALFQIRARADAVIVWGGVHIVESQYRTFFDVSDDGGRTWALRTGPEGFELPDVNNLFDATDASHFALTSGTELRISDDGGRTWQTRPDLPLGENGSLFPPIRFPSPDIGWITSRSGRILRTTDSGRTWSDVTDGGAPVPAVAPVSDGCPKPPFTTPPPGNPPPGLIDAAMADAATSALFGTTIHAAYPVGDARAGALGIAIANALENCGQGAVAASWIVELRHRDGKQLTAFLLAYEAGGWRALRNVDGAPEHGAKT